ncbi:hypothetical protein QQ008_22265 [Fulvivirgaceae bacterium BMA10]|uniref:Uncharacterized protein n=1 Tax=Splendidivirga corallicola TaxID=3051826 RepID=A0ABT8KVF3_9BACT|nr:hypothetical protein [Fulvivirgaceae bacterium BMA10]
MEVKLNNEEIEILREVLKQLRIRRRTGELGIIHGVDRFVSANIVFKKPHLELLDGIAQKIGVANGIGKTEK